MNATYLANGNEVLWTSNKKRVRRVKIVAALKAVRETVIVKITDGLPGERGQHRVIPTRRLAPKSAD